MNAADDQDTSISNVCHARVVELASQLINACAAPAKRGLPGQTLRPNPTQLEHSTLNLSSSMADASQQLFKNRANLQVGLTISVGMIGQQGYQHDSQ